MARQREDGTYVCDCGREFDSGKSIGAHSTRCEEYTSIGERRECEVCGEEFYAGKCQIEKGWGKYCSRECEGKSQENGEYRNCEVCGEEFYIVKSKIEKGRGKYCSNECKGKSRRNGEYRNCEVCGQKFYVGKSEIEKGHGKYCSNECNVKSQQNGEYRNCEVCGKEFYVKKGNIERGWGKYCSKKCQGKDMRLPKELREDGDYGVLWQDRRLEALARDNFECQDCGIRQPECRDEHSTGLHVHHKTPYREFDDDEAAHQLDNLVTLCPPCHRERERDD